MDGTTPLVDVATYHGAYISGVCLSAMMQRLYAEAHEGSLWYDLEGFCERRIEATDAAEACERCYLVLTGFRTPTGGDAADIVGALVVRSASQVSPHFLTYREHRYLTQTQTTTSPSRALRPRVLLLITETTPEVGSAKTDFTLFQSAGSPLSPASSSSPGAVATVGLVIANLRDSAAAFEAVVEAARLHPQRDEGSTAGEGEDTPSAQATRTGATAARRGAASQAKMVALLDEANALRMELASLERRWCAPAGIN